MKFALKGVLREIWKRPARATVRKHPPPALGTADAAWMDDEGLEDAIPYKLEPNLAEAEKFLDRIRRGGW